jgi:hypothetical protein
MRTRSPGSGPGPRSLGRPSPRKTPPYGLREGADIDPDNNLIRFGSPPHTKA